ncbi:hypothetical protein BJF85_03615 [Saccharomonospora sp. CUA-673]|uniref:hypothetical protein n=1 Tax=Saccharomonospora sp. CUA-673 TaxID=1904969 RepID=UPI0009692C38|nr:hypothetical protein [Saccharomonospora sp. CUA-673]OLT43148.1 hypothetical protein BJF85_03615 [Saccharomonospora sp. CUA-673]
MSGGTEGTDPSGTSGVGADSARLAEEIRLLVDLVTERAEPWLRGLFAAGHGGGDPTSCPAPDGGSAAEDDAGTGSACSWCPLCAVISVVRGEAPEIAARVLEQAAQVIALLRAVLADRWQPEEGVHMPGYRPTSRPGPVPEQATRPQPDPATAGASDTPGTGRRVHKVTVRRRDHWETQ